MLIKAKSLTKIIRTPISTIHTTITAKNANVRTPEAIFLQKTAEVPIISVTEKENVDMIGPPDPVSNLRPVVRKRLLMETPLQQRLREIQDDTQEWNQKFWAEHNSKFVKERQLYIESRKVTKDDTLTADEMSEFYKRFLDENWKTHVTYNFQWYRKNFELLFLSLRVYIEGLVSRHS